MDGFCTRTSEFFSLHISELSLLTIHSMLLILEGELVNGNGLWLPRKIFVAITA